MSELREQRERKHISQNELAIAVGVTQRHIAFIESGDRRPSMELAFKIAKEKSVLKVHFREGGA